MVSHLLTEEKKIDVNARLNDSKETPLFFALGKIKNNSSERTKIVKMLLDHPDTDIKVLNKNGKTCFEQYKEEFGFDEAATIVEKKYLADI